MCLAPCAFGMGGEVGRRFLVCNRLIDYVLNGPEPEASGVLDVVLARFGAAVAIAGGFH